METGSGTSRSRGSGQTIVSSNIFEIFISLMVLEKGAAKESTWSFPLLFKFLGRRHIVSKPTFSGRCFRRWKQRPLCINWSDYNTKNIFLECSFVYGMIYSKDRQPRIKLIHRRWSTNMNRKGAFLFHHRTIFATTIEQRLSCSVIRHFREKELSTFMENTRAA